MKRYVCPHCGKTMYDDEQSIRFRCQYCETPVSGWEKELHDKLEEVMPVSKPKSRMERTPIEGLEWILEGDKFGFGMNWTVNSEPQCEEEQAGYYIQRAIDALKRYEEVNKRLRAIVERAIKLD